MSIEFKRYPAERGTTGVTLACGCCCCCCCGHSVGGLIGALAVGSREDSHPGAFRNTLMVYWMWIAVLSVASAIYVSSQTQESENAFLVFVFFPVIQIAASFISAILLAITGAHSESFRYLGIIMFRSFIGTLLGALAMAGILMVLVK